MIKKRQTYRQRFRADTDIHSQVWVEHLQGWLPVEVCDLDSNLFARYPTVFSEAGERHEWPEHRLVGNDSGHLVL